MRVWSCHLPWKFEVLFLSQAQRGGINLSFQTLASKRLPSTPVHLAAALPHPEVNINWIRLFVVFHSSLEWTSEEVSETFHSTRHLRWNFSSYSFTIETTSNWRKYINSLRGKEEEIAQWLSISSSLAENFNFPSEERKGLRADDQRSRLLMMTCRDYRLVRFRARKCITSLCPITLANNWLIMLPKQKKFRLCGAENPFQVTVNGGSDECGQSGQMS